jgi:hypothetical protein
MPHTDRLRAAGWLPRPEGQATLLTLEQSLQPSVVPPKPLDRAVKGISARQVHYLLEDLRREVLTPDPRLHPVMAVGPDTVNCRV